MINWIEIACALVGYRHDHLGGVIRSTADGLLKSQINKTPLISFRLHFNRACPTRLARPTLQLDGHLDLIASVHHGNLMREACVFDDVRKKTAYLALVR